MNKIITLILITVTQISCILSTLPAQSVNKVNHTSSYRRACEIVTHSYTLPDVGKKDRP